jgi:hypothetical protein
MVETILSKVGLSRKTNDIFRDQWKRHDDELQETTVLQDQNDDQSRVSTMKTSVQDHSLMHTPN